MKIIISHDVDHITVLEHTRDLIIPKFIVRNSINFITNNISTKEYIKRYKDLNPIKNKWNNLEELILFDKRNAIPSTFFIAVNKGRGLSYSIEDSKLWIERMLKGGFKIGLHGISFNSCKEVEQEYRIFKGIIGKNKRIGIRIHDIAPVGRKGLHLEKKFLDYISVSGYNYDSSFFAENVPHHFKYKSIYEFPIHIMDGNLISNGSIFERYNSLNEIINETKNILDKAIKTNTEYFVVLFHDRYFNESYKLLYEWYLWLIYYLKNNNFEFTTFDDAVNSLDNKGK